MDRSLNRSRLGAIAGGVGLFCMLMGSSLPSYSAAAAEPAAVAETGRRYATVLRVRGERFTLTAIGIAFTAYFEQTAAQFLAPLLPEILRQLQGVI